MLRSPEQEELSFFDYKDSWSISQLLNKVSINGKPIIIQMVTHHK